MKKRVVSLALVVATILATVSVLVAPVNASPATIIVPDDQPTIQQAIDVAGSGYTVYVRSGTYYEHVTIGKSLTLQGRDRETTIIDGGGSGSVIYVSVNHVTISGLKITNGADGVKVPGSWSGAISHLTIRDTIIDSNEGDAISCPCHTRGYWLIEDCIISNNGGSALDRAHQANHLVIRNCEIYGNGGGLNVGWGSNAVVKNNSIHHNGGRGIYFDSMFRSLIENNEIYWNRAGLHLAYVASDNTIRDNIIYCNTHGIYLESGNGRVRNNHIYHNYLINNTDQVNISRSYTNYWDNGYPSGGNYWSDYSGVDNYSGPGQNVPGSDGIGDTPYVCDGNNQDNYPLMESRYGVPLDIKPTSCPNPLNVKSKGVLPVAILGTDSSDATQVDPSTITLQGVAPIRWAIEDVAAPYSPYIGKESCQDCTTAGPDGYSDLTLKFDTQAIVEALGEVEDGDCVKLTITGQLKGEFGGSPIIGEDLVWIVKKERGGG